MPKFMLLYHENPNPPTTPPSPEQMQAFLGMWTTWFQQCGAALLDGGDGLKSARKVLSHGIVSDGPFAEAKEVIGGYSVVETDTIDTAVELAKTCPIAVQGGTIEIREFAGYN